MIKNIIFDSDKTLVETSLATVRLFEYISEKYFLNADPVGVRANLKAAVDKHSAGFKNLPCAGYGLGEFDYFLSPKLADQTGFDAARDFKMQAAKDLFACYKKDFSEQTTLSFIPDIEEVWPTFYKANDESDILEYLLNTSPTGTDCYNLFVLTNGMSDVQLPKIESAGLTGYFKKIYSSEMFGRSKEDPSVYSDLLAKEGLQAHETMMLGDNPVSDYAASKKAGLTAVLYDRFDDFSAAEYIKIKSLREIKGLLEGVW